ncbi:MAG: nucleotidyltransferase domain-containing protein [Aquabacterium sp.]|uniref:type VII toxin-antitoxin system MntA family adenylyltransferase antitoxin n=1 Tax=Aquabacterium sp. TaxID=1872578 RepID=UPI0025BBCBC5|nr:nucleotidyltransferase domain-containing protein [Aquabacterium sp.]MBI5925010.1 nucleotidyltransferase domain-containing protein [Aquabacterium sp.]
MSPNHAPDLAAALADEGPVVIALRRAFPHALGIYAFGSMVQGTARSDSDLDLAILVEGYAAPLALWEAANELTGLLHRPVDLLDFRAASTVMQDQILNKGRRLWGKEPQAGLYECFAMSEKGRLEEARAGILTDIAKEGRVYGR